MSGQYKIKSLLCAAAFVLLAVAAVLVVKYWHHTLPAEECGEVYCRYSNRDDLKVSFLKDFRINDSTTVDVTTITAKDSASWEALLREMNIPKSQIDILRKSYNKGNQSVNHYYCVKGNPEQRTSIDYPEVDLVVYVQHLKVDRTFYVFDLKNKTQGRIILYHKSNDIQIKKK